MPRIWQLWNTSRCLACLGPLLGLFGADLAPTWAYVRASMGQVWEPVWDWCLVQHATWVCLGLKSTLAWTQHGELDLDSVPSIQTLGIKLDVLGQHLRNMDSCWGTSGPSDPEVAPKWGSSWAKLNHAKQNMHPPT